MPLLTFTAPREGSYLVRVFCFPEKPNSSIRFAGGADYVYRLTLTAGPFIDFTMPLAVQRGTAVDVAFRGANLPDGASAKVEFSGPDNWLSRGLADAAGYGALAVVDAPCLIAKDAAEPQPVPLPQSHNGANHSARPK